MKTPIQQSGKPQANSQEVPVSGEHEQHHFNRSVLFSFVRYAVMLLTGFGFSLIYARLLGSETLGTVALLTSVLGIFRPISGLGEQFSLVPVLNRYQGQDSQASGLFWTTVCLAGLVTLFLCIPYALITGSILVNVYHRPDLFLPLMTYLVGFYLVGNLVFLLSAPYQAYQQMKWFALVELVNGLLRVGMMVLLITQFGPSVTVAVWAQVAGFIMNVIVLLAVLPKVLKIIPGPFCWTTLKQDLREIYRFSFKALPGNASISVLQHADRLVLGYYAPASILGVYAITYSLFEKVLMMGVNYESMVFSSISKLKAKQAGWLHLPIFASALRSSFLLVTPIVVLMGGFADAALGVFGDDFTLGAQALSLLLLGILLDNFSRITLALMAGLGHPGMKALIMMTGGGVNVVFNLLLIPIWSLSGAALANTAGYFVTALLCCWWLRKHMLAPGALQHSAPGPLNNPGAANGKIDLGRSLATILWVNLAILLLILLVKPYLPFGLIGVVVFAACVLGPYYFFGRKWLQKNKIPMGDTATQAG